MGILMKWACLKIRAVSQNHKKYLIWLPLMIINLWVCLNPAEAISIPSELQFAEYLFENGKFYQAITEYKRYIFAHQNLAKNTSYHSLNKSALDSLSSKEKEWLNFAHYKIGLCYKQGKKWELAISSLEKVLDSQNNLWKNEAQILLAKVYINSGDYERARFELDDIIERNECPSIGYYWKGISYLYEYKFELASKEFEQVSEGDFVESACILQKECKSLKNLPYKSCSKANLISSFLPGAGQIYANDFYSGVASFLLNGYFAYATYKAIDRKDYYQGVILSTVGFSRFYFGGKENAYKAAQRFNRQLNIQSLEKMKTWMENP